MKSLRAVDGFLFPLLLGMLLYKKIPEPWNGMTLFAVSVAGLTVFAIRVWNKDW